MKSETRLLQIEPVLPSSDIARDMKWYEEKTGFKSVFSDKMYGVLRRENLCIHLQWHADTEDDPLLGGSVIRIFVKNIKPIFDEFVRRGTVEETKLRTETPWGTNEFGFYDPNNNAIFIAEDCQSEQMTTEIISATPDCEIVSSRIVNAPIDTVYDAWTEPGHLKVWWGPAGFTNTFNEFDLRVGGKWSFIMHGPERGNYHNECEFTVLEKPKLIAWKRHSKPIFQVVAEFEEVSADKTKIIFRQIFDSAPECAKVKAFAVSKNEENFDRLENELIKMIAARTET